MGDSLLIGEPPLVILPGLAMKIGLNEAIVVQQIYFLLKSDKNGKTVNDHRWIFNSYGGWRKSYFPFWSISTIQRIFDQLETMQLVISCQPEGRASRRKYYRLNEGMVVLMQRGALAESPDHIKMTRSARSRQNDTIDRIKMTSSLLGKTTAETTSSLPLGDECKERQKARPASEKEVIEFCKSQGIPETDGLYYWSKWEGNGYRNGGTAIKDWRAVIRSQKHAGYLPSQKSGRNGFQTKPKNETKPKNYSFN